jgi:hypothetical protein
LRECRKRCIGDAGNGNRCANQRVFETAREGVVVVDRRIEAVGELVDVVGGFSEGVDQGTCLVNDLVDLVGLIVLAPQEIWGLKWSRGQNPMAIRC